MAPAPSTVVNSADSTCGRSRTDSSLRTSGRSPAPPFGNEKNSAIIATTPSIAVARKDIRQPMTSPSQVATGTPPIFAIVSPINIVATALACLCLGTTLAATTDPRPKNAP
ncbi:hypothetical protein D3C80_1417470 [compost metagenome]